MRRFIGSLLHPERYHGWGGSRPYFEGWYFKLVDVAEQHRYAIIPGIFRGQDPAGDHAFVQVLDGMTGRATYHRYPADAFAAEPDRFAVTVGPNFFSANHLSLDIDDPDLRIAGDVTCTGLTPWPVMPGSIGAMGWYGWITFMECYHGVVSLDHTLGGALTVDGERIDFSGGRGYIEKDWGQAFPLAYIWSHSNHFSAPGTSLMASIAHIPWGSRAFRGFTIGLLHDGMLYRFATYSGAWVERLNITDSTVDWAVRDDRCRLELWAERGRGGLLLAPIRTEMHKRVDETMQSRVRVRLVDLKARTEILADEGRAAALEVHGALEKLKNA